MRLQEQQAAISTEYQSIPDWQRPVYGKSPDEVQRWAHANIAAATLAFENTLAPLQEAVGPDRFPTGEGALTKDIFYVPIGATSPEARAVTNTALALLDEEFARKDWVENEATSSYNPAHDILTLVGERLPDGTLVPRSAMHCTLRPAPGILMPAERAMHEDWGQDPVAVYNNAEAAGMYRMTDLAENIINSKDVLEVYTVASREGIRGAGDAIGQMGLTCVRTREDNGTKIYMCAVDEGLGGMLNKGDGPYGNGFKPLPGLDRINFHSNNPEGNNTTVQLCIAEEWRDDMQNPESGAFNEQQFDRFWTLGSRVLKPLNIRVLQ